jgi:hypothetical protein
MRIKFLLFFFLIYSFNLCGQSDSVKLQRLREYAWNLDNSLVRYDSSLFNLGDIQAKLKNYGAKVTADIRIGKSSLNVSLYVKDCQLVMAKTKEPSPKMSDLSAFTEFYFESDTVFHFRPYFSISGCMALPLFEKSMTEIFGYNPTFTEKYLLNLVRKLYSRVKAVANFGFTASLAGR